LPWEFKLTRSLRRVGENLKVIMEKVLAAVVMVGLLAGVSGRRCGVACICKGKGEIDVVCVGSRLVKVPTFPLETRNQAVTMNLQGNYIESVDLQTLATFPKLMKMDLRHQHGVFDCGVKLPGWVLTDCMGTEGTMTMEPTTDGGVGWGPRGRPHDRRPRPRRPHLRPVTTQAAPSTHKRLKVTSNLPGGGGPSTAGVRPTTDGQRQTTTVTEPTSWGTIAMTSDDPQTPIDGAQEELIDRNTATVVMVGLSIAVAIVLMCGIGIGVVAVRLCDRFGVCRPSCTFFGYNRTGRGDDMELQATCSTHVKRRYSPPDSLDSGSSESVFTVGPSDPAIFHRSGLKSD
jgi:hypothetical protein